jgi:voltage-gated potassium channel
MWWVVATLTTVGYGDVYPITGLGKLLASLIALLGIGMVALPTGVISAGFSEEVQTRKAATTVCPHCGKQISSN